MASQVISKTTAEIIEISSVVGLARSKIQSSRMAGRVHESYRVPMTSTASEGILKLDYHKIREMACVVL